ncbi:MAG: glutaredoxin domain-containing protein [Solirubrobacteraceae bacterium]|jgi:glutaredoxin 3
MPQITVYTTTPCPFCSQAKALLSKRGARFEEINLDRDADGRAKLVEQTGMMTFPQVIIDGELVGGFMELREADQSGRLRELLSAA